MDPIDPEEAARRKKTLYLLIGGASSLVLPLVGILYLRWSEGRGVAKQTASSEVFEQREGERRIVLPSAPAMPVSVPVATLAQAPAAPAQASPAPLPAGPRNDPDSGSLGFIKPSEDYFKDKPAETAPPPKEEPKAAPAREEARPAPKTAKSKPAKKPFARPKLNTTKGFTNFKRNQPGAEAAAENEDADMSDYLNNLPPGAANNPDIQKLLQQRK